MSAVTEPTDYQRMILFGLQMKYSGSASGARLGVNRTAPVMYQGIAEPEEAGHKRQRNANQVERDRARNKRARATRRTQRMRS